jgi:arsenate reductase
MKITIYQKPTCSTCREVFKALREAGVDVDSVDYYTEPLTRGQLTELVRKMGIPARELVRTKEPIYRMLKLGEREMSDAKLIDLMVEYPDLMQRPIVERGDRAILARPAERLREIL